MILFGNSFSGNIPPEIGNLQLRTFLAQDNNLSGEIPATLYDNVNLQELRLDGNNMGGTISNQIGNLKSLSDLRLGNNDMSGTIPFMFYGLNRLGKYKLFASEMNIETLNLTSLLCRFSSLRRNY